MTRNGWSGLLGKLDILLSCLIVLSNQVWSHKLLELKLSKCFKEWKKKIPHILTVEMLIQNHLLIETKAGSIKAQFTSEILIFLLQFSHFITLTTLLFFTPKLQAFWIKDCKKLSAGNPVNVNIFCFVCWFNHYKKKTH